MTGSARYRNYEAEDARLPSCLRRGGALRWQNAIFGNERESAARVAQLHKM